MTPNLMGLAMEGLKKTLISGACTLEKGTLFVTDLIGKMVLFAVV